MSLGLTISIPDHYPTLERIEAADFTPSQMLMIVQKLCVVAENSMRESLAVHTRTGATMASICSWPIMETKDDIIYGCGSLSRGAQLYWLDHGRREVRPLVSRYLHYFRWPEQVEVFSRYSRPTMGIELTRRAALDALSQSSSIIEESKIM